MKAREAGSVLIGVRLRKVMDGLVGGIIGSHLQWEEIELVDVKGCIKA